MSLFEEESGAPGMTCERCGRLCEPVEIDSCPVCRKRFCIYCAYHIASRRYCGRACGDSFFFGGDEDADDQPEEGE